MSRILCLVVIKRRVCHPIQQQAQVYRLAAQTSNTPVKRLCVEGKPHIESLDRPATLPISSQRMDLSDAPARVRFEHEKQCS